MDQIVVTYIAGIIILILLLIRLTQNTFYRKQKVLERELADAYHKPAKVVTVYKDKPVVIGKDVFLDKLADDIHMNEVVDHIRLDSGTPMTQVNISLPAVDITKIEKHIDLSINDLKTP